MAAAKAKPNTKVGVSERALIARINRQLKPNGQQLKQARGHRDNAGRWYEDMNLGRYYIIDLRRNMVMHHHVDLEAAGRELEVLAGWEKLETE
jgi:hypothetical protein